MKRIKDSESYKRQQKKRGRSFLRRVEAERVARLSHAARNRPAVSRAPWGYRSVTACTILSMVDNPDGTIAFFNRLLDNLDKKRRSHVELGQVKRIDYDAIVVLLSILVRFREKRLGFSGTFPAKSEAEIKLKGSGFFEVLYAEHFKQRDVYTLGSDHVIKTHANKSVDAKTGAEVIAEVSRCIWGEEQRSQGIQRVLLELMQNTNNHAEPKQPGAKHWWLSVHQSKSGRRAVFSFVDLGVGVFGSLKTKPGRSKWFGWRDKMVPVGQDGGTIDNAGVLRLIMEGHMHRTVTGEEFRGKGLPGVRQAAERGWMSRLVVVTNNVYADVTADTYELMPVEFRGTLVEWEVSFSNRHT